MAATPVTHKEPELTAPVMLCGPDSLLTRPAIGWSRHPLHTCNLPDSLPRKKKWNYWAVTSNDLLFSATIGHRATPTRRGLYLRPAYATPHRNDRGRAGEHDCDS